MTHFSKCLRLALDPFHSFNSQQFLTRESQLAHMVLNYEILLVTSKHVKEYGQNQHWHLSVAQVKFEFEITDVEKMALDQLVRAAFLEINNVSGTSFIFSV